MQSSATPGESSMRSRATSWWSGLRASQRFKVQVSQVEPQIEFQLVIVGLHVRAQLVEGLVVLGFLQVRQFMHHDHLQERRGGITEDGGDADLAAGLELA